MTDSSDDDATRAEIRDGRVCISYPLPASFNEREWIAAYGDEWPEELAEEIPRLMKNDGLSLVEAFSHAMWPEWAQMMLIERVMRDHIDWFEIECEQVERGSSIEVVLCLKHDVADRTTTAWRAMLSAARELDIEKTKAAARAFWDDLRVDPAWLEDV